jgi:hypothetical protein
MMQSQKMNRKRTLLLWLAVFYASGLFAQQTLKYQAKLQRVDTTGFFNIPLTPQVLAKAQANLADIRLVDETGKMIPYIQGNLLPLKQQIHFVLFPQVAASLANDTSTNFIAENRQGISTGSLFLLLRNTVVQRTINLAGSDDLQQWYAIKEGIALNPSPGEHAGLYEQELTFPSSTFRYFKVQVLNGRKEPVAILRVGVYQQGVQPTAYDELPVPALSQTDSSKKSMVILRFADEYPIDKVQLGMVAQKFFNRRIVVYAQQANQLVRVADTMINSTKPELLLNTRSKQLQLVIYNQDNPSLQVKSVQAFCTTRSVVAYLEKKESYRLLFGDPDMKAPDYDLRYFADSIKNNVLPALTGAVENNPLYRETTSVKTKSLPAWGLWVIIIGVIAVLAAFTVKLTREVKSRE